MQKQKLKNTLFMGISHTLSRAWNFVLLLLLIGLVQPVFGQDVNPCNAIQVVGTTENTANIDDSGAVFQGILINGETDAPIKIIKIYNSNWERIEECSGDCPLPFTFPTSAGDYFVHIQYYDANWNRICETENISVSVSEVSQPTNCEDINVDISDLIIENGSAKRDVSVRHINQTDYGIVTTIALLERGTGSDVLVSCGTDCEELINYTLEEGEYVIIISRFSITATDFTEGCDQFIFIDVNPDCADNDKDYICAQNDCDDNDAAVGIKYDIGVGCDDGNPNTENDVYLEDGCTCAGTPISTPDCNNVALSINPNNAGTIDISGLVSAHYIVKVYDENWNQLLDCSDDCASVGAYEAGLYRVHVQLYDENWQYICETAFLKITIDEGNTCEIFCKQPLIEFTSQAEVDAFCGCEIIEGDVRITGNITSLQPLNGIKQIKGFLAIFDTELTDFSGLESVELLETDLYVANNPTLKNLKGLENIGSISGALAIESNPLLESLDGLTINNTNSVNLSDNNALTSIQALNKITSLTSISIIGNKKLPNLEGLNNLTNIGNGTTLGGGYISLLIAGNESITTLSALSNLKNLDENLIIQFNPALTECCGIAHLLDDDLNNGQINSGVTIDNNLAGCNSVAQILEHCQTTPPDCGAIVLSGNDGKITIENLNAPIQIVKIYDENWKRVFECSADCDNPTIYETNPGNYNVQIQMYTENWDWICQTDNLKITVTEGSSPITDCEDIKVDISDLIIENGVTKRAVSVSHINQVSDDIVTTITFLERGITGSDVLFSCGTDCEELINYTLEEGEYVLLISRFSITDNDYEEGCNQYIFIDVNPDCVDNDKDYLCAQNDCDDNDATVGIMYSPGVSCDDGNPNTGNDVYLEDGCTCEGTPIGTPDCNNVALSINPNNASVIDIAGLTSPHYIVKVYDENWNQVLDCSDNCAFVGEYEAGLYRVHVQLYDINWQYICETEFLKITIGNVITPISCEDIITDISDLIIENGQARREVSITFNTPEGHRTGITLFDRSQGSGVLFDCGICEGDHKNFTLEEGEYVLSIDRSYLDLADGNLGCNKTFFIDVPAEPCTDNDGDYICDYNECNDNDPDVMDLKFPAGTSCNDGDDTTKDDVIQADGCTCAGTSISTNPCENVNISISLNNPGVIIVDGLTTGHQLVKVYDPNWNVVKDCSFECNVFGVFKEPGTYRVYAQLYDEDWQYICETDYMEIEIAFPEVYNDTRAVAYDVFDMASYLKAETVQLEWVVGKVSTTDNFVIERSLDGIDFKSIATIKNFEKTGRFFNFIDKNPNFGSNYYRVQQSFENKESRFSPTKKVDFYLNEKAIAVFPNPVQNKLMIHTKVLKGKKGAIKIYNAFGQQIEAIPAKVFNQEFETVDVASYQDGLYYLNIQAEKMPAISKKFLVEKMR